jgi:predicted nuclease of predicted toxin-antitoxin system
MRLLVDAQLPPGLARWLSSHGHEAQHVADVGLLAASDLEIWKTAQDTDAVIVTKDEDFVRLATQDPDGPPVVWLRVGNCTRSWLLSWMERAWPAVFTALKAGESIVEVSS